MTAKVLNRHRDAIPEDAVYIGRPSKWGNPYPIMRDQTREQVIQLYRAYIERRPALIAAAKAELRGKCLVCYCAPLPCHGDILLAIANE